MKQYTSIGFREYLYRARKRQERGREWLAAKAGVSYNTIYLFETKPSYNFTIKTAESIADALGYHLVWILEPKE